MLTESLSSLVSSNSVTRLGMVEASFPSIVVILTTTLKLPSFLNLSLCMYVHMFVFYIYLEIKISEGEKQIEA